MSDHRLMSEAALMLAVVVPGAIVPPPVKGAPYFEALVPEAYNRLSTAEKAAHDLAYELWIGDGPLARYLLNADGPYSRRLISAVTVACGPVTLDLAP